MIVRALESIRGADNCDRTSPQRDFLLKDRRVYGLRQLIKPMHNRDLHS